MTGDTSSNKLPVTLASLLEQLTLSGGADNNPVPSDNEHGAPPSGPWPPSAITFPGGSSKAASPVSRPLVSADTMSGPSQPKEGFQPHVALNQLYRRGFSADSLLQVSSDIIERAQSSEQFPSMYKVLGSLYNRLTERRKELGWYMDGGDVARPIAEGTVGILDSESQISSEYIGQEADFLDRSLQMMRDSFKDLYKAHTQWYATIIGYRARNPLTMFKKLEEDIIACPFGDAPSTSTYNAFLHERKSFWSDQVSCLKLDKGTHQNSFGPGRAGLLQRAQAEEANAIGLLKGIPPCPGSRRILQTFIGSLYPTP
jgi:hypothetical protein